MSAPIRDVSELNAVDAFDTIPDPIMILDSKGNIRYVNKAFSEKLKRFSKDTIGHHFLDIGLLVDMTEAAKKKAKQRFKLALRKKSLPSAEYRYERKDGESTYYLTNISIIEDSHGEVEHAIVFMRDITERKEAEERYQTLFDTAPIALAVTDIKGRIIDANQSMLSLTGHMSEELEGMDVASLYSNPEERKQANKALDDTESLRDFDAVLVRKDGTVFNALLDIDLRGDQTLVAIRDITDRKHAEEALKERMKELGCLYAIAVIAGRRDITVVDLLHEVVEVIPAGWQYPEITCAKLQFEDFETTTPNFKDTPWKMSADISIAGESVGAVEVIYLEEKKPFDEGPFLKEERSLVNAIADSLAKNIQRIRTEDTLHAIQQQLEAFVDSATDVIVLYDSELNLVMLNNAARNLIAPAIGDREPLGMHLLEISPRLKGTERYDAFRDVIKTGKPYIAHDYIPSPEFGDMFLDLRAFKVGEGLGIMSSDVTERQKIEDALRESEEKFRSTFDESPIALEILDADGIVIRANQACKEMFGLSSPEDLIGFSLFDDPNLHEDHKDSLRRNIIVREDLPFDFNLVKESNLYPTRKSGKLFLRTIFAPLGVKPDGSKSGYLVQMVDITDQTIAEQSIREANEKLNLLNEELETRVEIRTKELRDAQEELVRAERLTTLGQISGGVGHELRNPLGAIKNATYFLKIMMETPSSEIKETLEILDKEVENCEKIINSLLDYARPTEPVLQKVDIVELIQGALKRIEIPENINVQSKFSKTTPIILGDPHQLERVFLNLVTNSIQAMSDGGTLTLRTERKDGNLQFFVQDTGIGIPEDNMKKLFEPLFTTKAKGIGLGLSIVKTLVESHKGEISVESEVGKGTTFMIQLPDPKGRS